MPRIYQQNFSSHNEGKNYPGDAPEKHPALEKELERLSEEIRGRKEKTPVPETHEREIVRSYIGERIEQVKPTSPVKKSPKDLLPEYLERESPELRLKVGELADMAFHKGIDASIKEAKKYGPFILDAFHDTLTAKIYAELEKRGKL